MHQTLDHGKCWYKANARFGVPTQTGNCGPAAGMIIGDLPPLAAMSRRLTGFDLAGSARFLGPCHGVAPGDGSPNLSPFPRHCPFQTPTPRGLAIPPLLVKPGIWPVRQVRLPSAIDSDRP